MWLSQLKLRRVLLVDFMQGLFWKLIVSVSVLLLKLPGLVLVLFALN